MRSEQANAVRGGAGTVLAVCALMWSACASAQPQLAVYGDKVFTMAGDPIANGVVLIAGGKITAVGKQGDVQVPQGIEELRAAVVTPGLIDAHSTVGLSGVLNIPHDQDQLERSQPIQPELRAIDSYNPREPLVEWVRSFGVTTLHTGHAPGELISGLTLVVKTAGSTADSAAILSPAAVAMTLSERAIKSKNKSPGTRSKQMAMLRQEFIKAREYQRKRAAAKQSDKPAKRDLGMEVLARVLEGELPVLCTAQRAQDIANALRLSREFGFRLILDGAAEAYLLIDEIREQGVPVVIHPTMQRAKGESENLSMETAAQLVDAGVHVALQSGYEGYVPKTRVVLFEAAVAAANGLGFERALATITVEAARLLGVADRVGTLEVGKDADVALFDGDPFEYTSHCTATVVNGAVLHSGAR